MAGDSKPYMTNTLNQCKWNVNVTISRDERGFTASDALNGVRLKIPKRYLFLTHEFMTSRL